MPCSLRQGAVKSGRYNLVKILLIGNTSMVAKRLRPHLAALGTVLLAGRGTDVDLQCDLETSCQLCGDLNEADIIVHCAASFEGNDLDGAIKNEMVNAVGSFRVAQLAVALHCRHVVYVSSIFSHEHPQNGYFGSYGLSKRHGQENLEWACRREGIGCATLHVAQIYDEYGEARKHQPMFYRIMDAAKSGKDVHLFGGTDPERNFVFVEDVAEVVARVVARGITGAHPVVHPVSNRLAEIARHAFDVFGTNGTVLFLKDKPALPNVFVPPRNDLYERIQYAPKTDIVAGIRLIREHLR
jgi:nucleoside-diphosphate-sugar epimerase